MTEKLETRDSVPGDWGAIESLYPEAFPDEDLLPLVRDLLPDTAVATSLVGTIDAQIVGHAIFTRCSIVGDSINAALLGPLLVAPARHRQGIGSAIVQAGFRAVTQPGRDHDALCGKTSRAAAVASAVVVGSMTR